MTVGMHCIVSGRVQGVTYRAATQRRARELGLAGWVRNLADGSVELCAFGAADGLAELREWLWVGSPSARVAAVVCKAAAPAEAAGIAGDFEVRR
jgi:acylphosphatase